MNSLLLRLLPFGAAIVVGFGSGWALNGWRWGAKYDKLHAEYQQFKGGVAALGEAAKAKNAVITLNNLKAKERADEENDRRHRAVINTIVRLRHDADRARSRDLPPAPVASSRPDLLCLDRAEYQRAHGEALGRLREGARRLADEGTAATIDLDTAKRWVLELKLSTTLKE